jgi:peptide/nickel transport system permease protein
MLQYGARRLVSAIPVLLGILVVVFFLSRSIPGDPCKAMLGEKVTAEACERFRAQNGLDDPLPIQFLAFMGRIVQGDLGESIRFSRPVALFLAERLPTTIELAFAALVLAVVVGIPLGIVSALRHNSPTDVVTMVGANIGVSMPVFWLGLMLAYLFAIVFKDTPLALPPTGRISPGLSPTPFYEVYGLNVVEGTA